MSTTPAAHAQFPPSSMHRVITCPASWKLEQVAPPQVPNPAAIHGTFLHDVIAYHLLKGIRPSKDSVPKEITPSDLNLLKDHYDYVLMVFATCSSTAEMAIEKKCDLSPWGLSMLWGTPDIVIKDYENSTIHVLDHKFGVTPVYANANPQLMIYAAGFTGYPPGALYYKLHILQYSVFETPDTYECEAKELEKFIMHDVSLAIEEAQSSNPRFNPDQEACRFCRGGMVCRARLDMEYSKALKVVRGMSKTPMVSLEELAQFFDYTETVVKYRSQISKYLTEKILAGEAVPTKKVVAGRKSYKWKSEEELLNFVASRGVDPSNLFTSKIMSPHQVKTAYRKFKKDEDFQKLIETQPGKPQLVSADDKRPDYLSLNDIDFGAL